MSLSDDLQGIFFSPSNLPKPVFFVSVVATVFVVVVIVGWLVRSISTKQRGGAAARNCNPQLAVIDVALLAGRRKLIIIRRDNVEHLLIIGGPSDVVVETNILRGNAATTAREAGPVRAHTMAESLPRTRAPALQAARQQREHRHQQEHMVSAASAGTLAAGLTDQIESFWLVAARKRGILRNPVA